MYSGPRWRLLYAAGSDRVVGLVVDKIQVDEGGRKRARENRAQTSSDDDDEERRNIMRAGYVQQGWDERA